MITERAEHGTPAMKQSRTPLWRRLLEKLLYSESESEVYEARKLLLRLRSRKCKEALIKAMCAYGVPQASERAAYALMMMQDTALNDAFVACLKDRSQHELVRGQAAEALGSIHDYGRRTKWWRSAEKATIEALDDPSPVVRFWCCYALSCLRSERAVPKLQELSRTDTALMPGWWYVHEEAEDALTCIAGGFPDSRIPMNQRRENAT